MLRDRGAASASGLAPRRPAASGWMPPSVVSWRALARERGGRRPQPQGLVEDAPDVAEPGDLSRRRASPYRPRPPPPRPGAGEYVRVAREVVQGEGEGAGGGLVSGDEEGEDLVADVLVREALAGLRVGGRSIRSSRSLREPASSSERRALTTSSTVRLRKSRSAALRFAAPRSRSGPTSGGDGVEALGVGERADHGVHEGVGPGAFEGAEVVAEAGAGDGLQGQLRHVPGHVDRAARRRLLVPVVR